MIEAKVVPDGIAATIPAGTMCKLEPGTLELRPVKAGEVPSCVALMELRRDEAVSILPIDGGKLTQLGYGTRVDRPFVPSVRDHC